MNHQTKQIPEIWASIVKKIGGKHIKKFTMTCSTDENIKEEHFSNPYDVMTDIVEDVILLKRSDTMEFCTYNLRDRSSIFDAEICNIEKLYFKEYSPKQYVISIVESNNLSWILEIEMA